MEIKLMAPVIIKILRLYQELSNNILYANNILPTKLIKWNVDYFVKIFKII